MDWRSESTNTLAMRKGNQIWMKTEETRDVEREK